MYKPFIFNKRLNDHWKTYNNEYMARKLQNVKPMINMKCPESFKFYQNQFHKASVRNNRCKIFKYNIKHSKTI